MKKVKTNIFKKFLKHKKRQLAFKIGWILSLIIIPVVSFILIILFGLNALNDKKDFFSKFNENLIPILFGGFTIVLRNLLIIIIVTIVYFISLFIYIYFKVKVDKHEFISEIDNDELGSADWMINDEEYDLAIGAKDHKAFTKNKDEVLEKREKQLINFNTFYTSSSLKIQREIAEKKELAKPLKQRKNVKEMTFQNRSGWVVRSEIIDDEVVFNYVSETQAIAIGATGSGKSQKVVMPTAIYNASFKEYLEDVYDDEFEIENFDDLKKELNNIIEQIQNFRDLNTIENDSYLKDEINIDDIDIDALTKRKEEIEKTLSKRKLLYKKALNPNMVFTDPKGELYRELAAPLEKRGYKVLTLNLNVPAKSSGWNPLQIPYNYWVNSLTFEKDNIKKESVITMEALKAKIKKMRCFNHYKNDCLECFDRFKEEYNIKLNKAKNNFEEERFQTKKSQETGKKSEHLSDTYIQPEIEYYLFDGQWFCDEKSKALCINSKKTDLQSLAYEQIATLALTLFPVDKDPIWPLGAQNIFKGVIYAMFEILENDINAIPLEKFNMVNVAKLLTQQEKLVEWFTKYKAIGNNAWKKSVLECSNEIFGPENTMKSFFATLSQGITIFKDSALEPVLCRNEIDLQNFTDKKIALFLIIPDERENRHVLASLFISQLYQAGVYKASQSEGLTLPRQIYFYLDEFGNMPKIAGFDSYITVARSRGMFFMIIVQGFSQLYEKYGNEKAKTIINNCNLDLYIATKEEEVAEAFSKRIGEKTVIKRQKTFKAKDEPDRKESETLEKMRLIESSEILKLDDEYGLTMYTRKNPSLVKFVPAFKCEIEINPKLKNPYGKSLSIKNTSVIHTVNFERDHMFNMWDYEVKDKETMEQEDIQKQLAAEFMNDMSSNQAMTDDDEEEIRTKRILERSKMRERRRRRFNENRDEDDERRFPQKTQNPEVRKENMFKTNFNKYEDDKLINSRPKVDEINNLQIAQKYSSINSLEECFKYENYIRTVINSFQTDQEKMTTEQRNKYKNAKQELIQIIKIKKELKKRVTNS